MSADTKSNIAENLTDLITPISELTEHPENPRRGDVEVIAQSLQRFGQVKPIVAQLDGTVIAGNHSLKAARDELMWDEIACVRVDLPDDEAKAFLLADNRTSDIGSYENQALAGILEELMEAGQLQGTGYEPDDVDDILAEMGEVQVTETEEFKGDYIESPEETEEYWNKGEDGEEKPHSPMREVVLMLKGEEFTEFAEQITKLKKAYGMEATTVTVREAVRREVERLDG